MYPACSRRALTIENIRATGVVANLKESLELPSQPAGYHFMLQTCAKALLERKHAENMLTRDKEWICGSTQVEHRYVLMKSSLGGPNFGSLLFCASLFLFLSTSSRIALKRHLR